jgi:hypothetical protein
MDGLIYEGPGRRSWATKPDPTIQDPTDVVVKIGSSRSVGPMEAVGVPETFELCTELAEGGSMRARLPGIASRWPTRWPHATHSRRRRRREL